MNIVNAPSTIDPDLSSSNSDSWHRFFPFFKYNLPTTHIVFILVLAAVVTVHAMYIVHFYPTVQVSRMHLRTPKFPGRACTQTPLEWTAAGQPCSLLQLMTLPLQMEKVRSKPKFNCPEGIAHVEAYRKHTCRAFWEESHHYSHHCLLNYCMEHCMETISIGQGVYYM